MRFSAPCLMGVEGLAAQELRELVLEGAEETPVARLLRLLEPVKR